MTVNTKPHIHELVICTNIFIKKDRKWLLLKRSPFKKFAPNVIHPFGGKLDPHENPFVGAEREILEEVGIKIKKMKLEAVITEIQPVKEEPYDWLIFHFSAEYESGVVKQTDEGEAILLSKKEIKKSELFPSVRRLIDHILNPRDGTVFATFKYEKTEGGIQEVKKDLCQK